MSINERQTSFSPAGAACWPLATWPDWRGGRNGWWDTNALWDFDAKGGRSMAGGSDVALSGLVAVARASTHLLANASGIYQSFGNNVLARNDNVGAYVGGARTNLCTNYNANPTDLTNIAKYGDAAATLTVVDDATALAAAGLSNICSSGKVYKLDNSLGTGNALARIDGTTVGAYAYYQSIFIRMSGAGSAGTFGLMNGTNNGFTSAAGTFGNTSSYIRYSGTVNGDATARAMGLRIPAGAIVYFILNTMSQAIFASPPILTTGSAATRLASDVTAANMAWFAPLDGVGATEIVVPKWSHVGDGVDRPLFEYVKDANNYIRGYVNASDKPALKIVSGGVTQTDTALTTAITTGRKPLVFGWSASGGYIGDAAGNVATFGAVTLPSAIVTDRWGSSQAGNYLNDILERRATLRNISQAQALALAAAA